MCSRCLTLQCFKATCPRAESVRHGRTGHLASAGARGQRAWSHRGLLAEAVCVWVVCARVHVCECVCVLISRYACVVREENEAVRVHES
jgi:hypothetical protein